MLYKKVFALLGCNNKSEIESIACFDTQIAAELHLIRLLETVVLEYQYYFIAEIVVSKKVIRETTLIDSTLFDW